MDCVDLVDRNLNGINTHVLVVAVSIKKCQAAVPCRGAHVAAFDPKVLILHVISKGTPLFRHGEIVNLLVAAVKGYLVALCLRRVLPDLDLCVLPLDYHLARLKGVEERSKTEMRFDQIVLVVDSISIGVVVLVHGRVSIVIVIVVRYRSTGVSFLVDRDCGRVVELIQCQARIKDRDLHEIEGDRLVVRIDVFEGQRRILQSRTCGGAFQILISDN